jgi:hypothetical protein
MVSAFELVERLTRERPLFHESRQLLSAFSYEFGWRPSDLVDGVLPGDGLANAHIEPPREKWRLQTLRGMRGWSHDTTGKISSGATGTGSPPRGGARARVSIAVGGDYLDCGQVWDDAGDAAGVGAAG